MQKNTKVLLGLGLIGLAYYLWNKSSKKQQDVNSNMPTNPTGREIPIGQPNKCEILYLKALAGAKQAASMGAFAGIPPKEIFMKQCEVAGNPIQESEIGSAYGYDTPYMPQAKPEIGSAYMDVVIPKGTKIEGAKVFGYGVSFITDKVNKYDYGIGQAKFGEFDVTSIVSNERQDPAPFEQPKVVNGYSLYIGNIVNVVLTKDVVRSVPTKLIIIN